jgi:hypothetical protein
MVRMRAVARLWRSGWVRLAVLVLVAGAAAAVVAVTGRDTPPSPSQRAAAERVRLHRLHREQVRLRLAARRDPVLRRERARLRMQQRARYGRGRPGRGSRAAQSALVTALERSITRDANARFRSGELDKPALATFCVRFVRPQVLSPPPPPLSARQAGYECTAATTKFHTVVSRTGTAILGFPFWARVNFRTGRYAWCKINLLPSEHAIGDQEAFVPLAPVCDLLRKGGPA